MHDRTLTLCIEYPHSCPYLPDRITSNLRFSLQGATPEMMEALLENGFRHFGNEFFRPACPGCTLCSGLRIPLQTFLPNRSQRRCLKENQDLLWNWEEVRIDDERLELLNRFQASRSAGKGWGLQQFDAKSYATGFIWDATITREMSVRDRDGRLVAVGIVDHAGTSLSGVYHYHDPDLAWRGLGTWMILQQLSWGLANHYDWLYLGLWNPETSSLAYKGNFLPHQCRNQSGDWLNLTR